MARVLSRPEFLGRVFLGVGIWGLVSLPLDWWVKWSIPTREMLDRTPFYDLFVNVRSLPEFYPLTIGLALIMIFTGFGFLKLRPWAKSLGLTYVFLSMLGTTLLCLRYIRTFDGISGWLMGIVWVAGMTFFGALAIYLSRASLNQDDMKKDFLNTYEQIYWNIIRGLIRFFGVGALILGTIFGVWGFRLLIEPTSVVSVDGSPTTALAPKMIITLLAGFLLLIGVVCTFGGLPLKRSRGNS